jgi:drug/metabolite transporter (DMT)-like permease
VWIFLGERPSDLALVGGLVVLGSLVANEAARSRVAT